MDLVENVQWGMKFVGTSEGWKVGSEEGCGEVGVCTWE